MDAEFRLTAFIAVLLVMIIWEKVHPRRQDNPRRRQRWPVNIGLVVISSILVRLTVGGIVYHSALLAEEKNFGLMNWLSSHSDASSTGLVILSLILLDVIIYGQHVASHKIPLLWRLHQVHHSDSFCDTTTGIRFHPLEIFFSLGVKVIAVCIIGAEPVTVIIFEIILNTCSVFNHSNIDLPLGIDKQLRKVIVTPDMHRVHHSIYRDETDSNYGFSLSIWDRIFGTYKDQPRDGHATMQIGLRYIRQASLSLKKTILMPLHLSK